MERPKSAPIRNVFLADGSVQPLQKFYAEKPLALVFVRHLGCVFCKDQVLDLRGEHTLNIAFVVPAGPAQAREFAQKMQVLHPMFCEPEGDLYREFGLREGRLSQFVSPRVITAGLRATLRTGVQGRPIGNPLQLGGTFVIDTDGYMRLARPAKDAADHLSVAEIRDALCAAEEPLPEDR